MKHKGGNEEGLKGQWMTHRGLRQWMKHQKRNEGVEGAIDETHGLE